MDIFKEGTKIFNDSQVNTQPEFKMCSKCVQVQWRMSEIILSFKYADKITIQLFEWTKKSLKSTNCVLSTFKMFLSQFPSRPRTLWIVGYLFRFVCIQYIDTKRKKIINCIHKGVSTRQCAHELNCPGLFELLETIKRKYISIFESSVRGDPGKTIFVLNFSDISIDDVNCKLQVYELSVVNGYLEPRPYSRWWCRETAIEEGR